MNRCRLTNSRMYLCQRDARPPDVAIPGPIIEIPAYVVIPAFVLLRCTCDCRHLRHPD